MTKVAIITGSTRPGRQVDKVTGWVYETAIHHSDATFEIVDVGDYDLGQLDEPTPAALSADYTHPHTKQWSSTIDSFDAFVFVTPEYNHSLPGALKNAIDFLFTEWNDKAAGFVSYGLHGGTRAVEHLRLVMAELKVADVRTQVALSLFDDFEGMADLRPRAHQPATLARMLDELVAWAGALKRLREDTQSRAAA
jgi:NAD(P)H-dependent FMN reductase